FSKGQSGERGELRGLKHHGVAGGERGGNLPRQHEQGKIPRNDLTNDTAGLVTGKFLCEELCPTGVMVEMAGDQRNIDVAAFTNRLAVVKRFQDGEAARMLLHLTRQRVEKLGTLMCG